MLVVNAARGLASVIDRQETWLLYPVLFGKPEVVSDELKKSVTEILTRRGHRIPDAEQAAATLFARAKDYYEKNRPLKSDVDGMVSFWIWNATEKKVEHVEMSVPDAYRHFAWHYARQAWQIEPEQPAIQTLYVATTFEFAAYKNGLDKPIPADNREINDVAELIDIKSLEQILSESMNDGHAGAAQVAATMLGMGGNAEDLLVNHVFWCRPPLRKIAGFASSPWKP